MNLNGTYRGFSPTDESGVGAGELEMVILDDTISFRFATGLTVDSHQVARAELREMTTGEVADRFSPGADITSIAGYMLGEVGPIFLFLPELSEAPESPRVIVQRFVSDETDAIFGPSMLFTPGQVEAGYFDQAVRLVEEEQGDPGVVPRLDNNGLRR